VVRVSRGQGRSLGSGHQEAQGYFFWRVNPLAVSLLRSYQKFGQARS
jgi:hypothetical protein